MGRAFVAACLLAACAPLAPAPRPPIIDMHMHAYPVGFAAGAAVCTGDQDTILTPIDPNVAFTPDRMWTCPNPIVAPATDADVLRDTLRYMDEFNIRRAVTSGAIGEVGVWRAAAPDRIVPALGFGGEEAVSVETFRRLYAEGAFLVFAEVLTQYRGVAADDAMFEPFFAMAEELDIPVGIHLGEGPPAAARFPGYETYRASLTSPFQLERVLVRHPRLRIYVMHYASPLVDEMLAMMYTHPNLYVDVSANNWGMRRAEFYDHLKRMVDAGFEQRIMYGSDQMIWPDAIPISIESIEDAPFLNDRQKRAIFYDNAARFLRLSEAEIARDHGR